MHLCGAVKDVLLLVLKLLSTVTFPGIFMVIKYFAHCILLTMHQAICRWNQSIPKTNISVEKKNFNLMRNMLKCFEQLSEVLLILGKLFQALSMGKKALKFINFEQTPNYFPCYTYSKRTWQSFYILHNHSTTTYSHKEFILRLQSFVAEC